MQARNGSGGPDRATRKRPPRTDYWPLLVRRRRSLMIPFMLLGACGVVVSRLVPMQFRSEATVLVEQQKVPEQYVVPNVMANLQYRLDSMTQQILSRTRLQRIIEDFGLFSGDRPRMTLDDLVDRMRKRIDVELVQTRGSRQQSEVTAFKVYFTYEDAKLAQRVANELTSLFIEENLRARTQQSVSTTTFLENQLDQAGQALLEQEKKLREFKTRNQGGLPEQEAGNLQILGSLESQLQLSADALDRAEQQKIYFESLSAAYKELDKPAAGEPAPGAQLSPALVALQTRVQEKRDALAAMRARYTPAHPDLVAMVQQVAQSEALLKKLEAAAASNATSGRNDGDGARFSSGAIEAASRLNAINAEIAARKKESDKLKERVQQLQGQLRLTPVREQELAEITRNYENSRSHYHSLLQKKLDSELATNLEKRQQGEQFRVIDPASLPDKPSSPNRWQIILAGWLVGLGVGFGFALLREFVDNPLRTEQDIALYTKAAVLVRVPVLQSSVERRRRRLLQAVEAGWASVAVLLSFASVVYSYLLG